MRHSKNRLMELPNLPGSKPTLMLTVTPMPVLDKRPPAWVPAVNDDLRMALFEQLVLSIKKTNAMKEQLNAYHQWCRIDPDEIEVVSDDEPEEAMPDITDFLSLP